MAFVAEEMDILLNPTSVAIVGASEKSVWTQATVGNLRSLGFVGNIHMVNPKRDLVLGQTSYPSIADIPDKVDHALILTPAGALPSILEDVQASNVHAATVIASGFQEAGLEGKELANKVEAFCNEHRIAMIGPNCYGFSNYTGKAFLTRNQEPGIRSSGKIGMSFQSGGLYIYFTQLAYARGVDLGFAVSSGNELVLNANDYYDYFLSRDDISVIGGTLESIPEPERFAEIAVKAREMGKPIVLLKLGRSSAMQQLSVAHTGSVAGSDVIVDTYLRDLGVIRVDSLEELVDTAGLLAEHGWPRGNRTFFTALSGGSCGLIAETAEPAGIDLVTIDEQLRNQLAEITKLTPSTIHNPFDSTAEGLPKLNLILDAASDTSRHDVVMVNVSSDHVTDSVELREIARIRDEFGVYVTAWVAPTLDPAEDAIRAIREQGVPVLRGPHGAKALGNAMWYSTRLAELANQNTEVAPATTFDPALLRPGTLTERESKDVIRAYGIDTPAERLVTMVDEAAAAANEIGYPVVLKIVSPDIAHKSEAGGVLVGLKDEVAVRAGFETVMASAQAYRPGAKVEGVLVCESISGAAEFFVGLTSDPEIGQIVVAGLGGIYVEILKDVVTMTPPVSKERAEQLLRKLKSAEILNGARGKAPLDFEAFVDAVVKVSHLAYENRGRIVEVDINPLFVLTNGKGVRAADALIVVKGED